MTVRWAVLCMSGFAVLACREAAAQTPEEQLVQEMYGKQIAAAKATASDADDIALAKQLLTAAADDSSTQKLKYVLARTVINLLSSAGSEEAVSQSRRALDIADRIQPMQPAEKAAMNRDIAARCLANAQEERKRADLIGPLAREAAKAHMEYAQAAMRNPDELTKAESSVGAAMGIIQNYKLSDLSESLAALQKAVAAAKARSAALQVAANRLKAAQASKSEAGIKAANKTFADAYLTYDADLVTAAKHLAGTDDPRESAVAAAAAYLSETKLDANTCLESVQTLLDLSKGFSEDNRAKIADCGLHMCKAYLAGKTSEIGAAKARLLIVQLQQAAGVSEGDELRKKIEAAYRGLGCKLEVLEGMRVRATYDFSDEKQMKDWDGRRGTWGIGKGVLACKTEPGSSGEAANKLRFRADRPFKVSFSGGARYELTCLLYLYGPGSSAYYYYYNQFTLSSYSGVSLYAYGASWSESKARLQDGKVYKFEISGDGKGGLAWSINGVLVREVKPSVNLSSDYRGNFGLNFRTESSEKAVTAFDDVAIEGEIVAKPQ